VLLGSADATAAQKSEAGRNLSALSRNGTLQATAQVGRSGWIVIAGRVFFAAGIVIGGFENYSDDIDNGDSVGSAIGKAAIQTAGDTAIGWDAVWAGAEFGGYAGSAFGPEGVLVGIGVGALVGAGAAYFGSSAFNGWVSSWW
jgi:hypothetical protein